MENISNKFPSIYNSKYRNQINIKLYNKIPYREIERWLKEESECEDDCISHSTIGKYARYVNERGGFEQLLTQELLNQEDVTYSQLCQKAINISYSQLDELTGQNLVNLIKTIFQHSLPMHFKIEGEIQSDVTVNLLEEIKRKQIEDEKI